MKILALAAITTSLASAQPGRRDPAADQMQAAQWNLRAWELYVEQQRRQIAFEKAYGRPEDRAWFNRLDRFIERLQKFRRGAKFDLKERQKLAKEARELLEDGK